MKQEIRFFPLPTYLDTNQKHGDCWQPQTERIIEELREDGWRVLSANVVITKPGMAYGYQLCLLIERI